MYLGESHISLILFWILWHQCCPKARNCLTASAETVSGSGDVNTDTVVFLLAMELEMFPKSCCDVVSQSLPTLGHCTDTKELVLDVKKTFRSHKHAGKKLSLNVAKPSEKGSFASVLSTI